jgi:hypothetical protein
MRAHRGGRGPSPYLPALAVAVAVVLIGFAATAELSEPGHPTVTTCAGSAGPEPPLVSVPTLDPAELSTTRVRAAVSAVDELVSPGSSIRYGVAVTDRVSGQTVISARGADTFLAASVVKVLTAIDLLHRPESEPGRQSSELRETLDRALRSSDDEAMNALWLAAGPDGGVARTAALVGLRDTRPPHNPGQWGETLISARDVVAMYDFILTAMSPDGAQTLIGALSAPRPTGTDGFDQSFGLLDTVAGTDRAVKQGWMTHGDSIYLHTTGLLGPKHRYLVAVLTEQPQQGGYAQARAAVTAAVHGLSGALELTRAPLTEPDEAHRRQWLEDAQSSADREETFPQCRHRT